jgi:hypothetical protein
MFLRFFRLHVVAVAVAMQCASSAAIGEDVPYALFQGYAVKQVYSGPLRMPDFNGRDRTFADFRTRIREGILYGPNFAGHYALIGWGCGTECVDYVVADVATGEVHRFPLYGEDFLELTLSIRAQSTLVVAHWLSWKGGYDNPNNKRCMTQRFIWKSTRTVPLDKPKDIGNSGACN